MTSANRVHTLGRCAETGKIQYATRADAKRVRERKPEMRVNRPYLCDHCGYHHLGRDHGIGSRGDHREFHGDTLPVDEPPTMTLREAAVKLYVRRVLLEGMAEQGLIKAHAGDDGQVRIQSKEVHRLATLMLKDAG